MYASVIRKLVGIFGTLWVCEYVFLCVKYVKSKYTLSISDTVLCHVFKVYFVITG